MVANGQPRVLKAGAGRRISFAMGNVAEVKAAGDSRLGFGFMRATLPKGAGMPLLHVHRSLDEAFEVFTGSIEYRLGDGYVTANAGDSVLVPAGVPHCFRTVSQEPATVVVIVSDGSGIDMIEELATGNLMDPTWTAAVLERYDTELLEPKPHWAAAPS